MRDAPTPKAFFGDGDKTFALPPEMILELERVTGMGIGAFASRFFARDFSYAGLTAVIRLGLIGGGTSPKDAAAMIDAYAAGRPLMEIVPLAVSILEAVMFGTAQSDQPEAEQPAEEAEEKQ